MCCPLRVRLWLLVCVLDCRPFFREATRVDRKYQSSPVCLRVQTGFASSVKQAHFSSAGPKSRLIQIFSSASQLRIACRTGDGFGCLPRSMAGRSTGTRCGEVLNSFVAKLPLRNQLFCLRPVPQHPRARQVRGKGNTTRRTTGARA